MLTIENMSNTELLGHQKSLKTLIKQYDNLQSAKKICLNSSFGSLSNQFFLHYDVRQGEGITTSGQLIIQWAENILNNWFNKLLKTKGKDYCIASDTDSIILHFAPIIDKVMKDTSNMEKCINFMDNVAKEKIQPILDNCFNDLADYLNVTEQKMYMKREKLASRGFWTGKKHYALSVWDSEGVRYNEPELDVKGLELVKSTTPGSVKKYMKETIKLILTKSNEDVISYIDEARIAFMKLPIEDIASGKGAGALDDYHLQLDGKFSLKTPSHIKAALLYNDLLKKKGLDKKYPLIRTGEKIKYIQLIIPNTIGNDVIAFADIFPPELNLTKYVDYDKQFEKVFFKPIEDILNAIGWKAQETNSLF